MAYTPGTGVIVQLALGDHPQRFWVLDGVGSLDADAKTTLKNYTDGSIQRVYTLASEDNEPVPSEGAVGDQVDVKALVRLQDGKVVNVQIPWCKSTKASTADIKSFVETLYSETVDRVIFFKTVSPRR